MTDNSILDKDFDYERSEEQDGQGLSRYTISSYTMDRPIETLIKWKENGKLQVPDFQRDYIWTYYNCCRFIDSILLNLPIPGIFVFKVLDGKREEKYLLVDGMQRITTIEQYKNGIWKQEVGGVTNTKNFKINLKKSDWNQKSYDDLLECDKQFFLDYSFSLTIFESVNDNEIVNMNSMFEVFERLNTGGEKLSEQEIRNAIYRGECLTIIKKCMDCSSFTSLIKTDKAIQKRGKNVEFYLRLLCYYHIYKLISEKNNFLIEGVEESKITTSKNGMLNNFLLYSNNGKIDYLEIERKVIRALEVINNLTTNSFCARTRDETKIGKVVHQVFSEALVIATIENDFIINLSKSDFETKKMELWASESFYADFVEKTTLPVNIIKRVERMVTLIRGDSS